MAHTPGSLTKVAVLTGLTALVGGVHDAGAAPCNGIACTLPQTLQFNLSADAGGTDSTNLTFNQFNSALGNLTSVDFSINSVFEASNFSASIFVNSVPLSSNTAVGSFSGLQGSLTTAFYTGTSTFAAALDLESFSGGAGIPAFWSGGLTLVYDYTPTAATPLPAALPLFASGVAGIGVATWRSRRKRKSVQQA
jgi:hypothetical protein